MPHQICYWTAKTQLLLLLRVGWLSLWLLAGQRPFSAPLLWSHVSTYFYLPSYFVFTGWNQCPWVVSFTPNLSSLFLKFDVLAMTSPITLSITSMTIYVKPPQIFFIYRTSPTITLPWNFSIIWKLQHIIICQVLPWGPGDMLCIPFCDGKICWIVIRLGVWRWMHPIFWVSLFWHNFIGYFCFQCWCCGTIAPLDNSNLSGNVIHYKRFCWNEEYYYWWRSDSHSLSGLPLDPAVQDCTFLLIARSDDDGW